MVGVVVVRKVHGRAGRDREHVRHEGLVALIHPRVRLVARIEGRAWRGVQVDDAAAPVRDVVRGRNAQRTNVGAAIGGHVHRRHLDAPADGPRYHRMATIGVPSERAAIAARRAQQQGDPDGRGARLHHQNQYATSPETNVRCRTRPPSRVLYCTIARSVRLRWT